MFAQQVSQGTKENLHNSLLSESSTSNSRKETNSSEANSCVSKVHLEEKENTKPTVEIPKVNSHDDDDDDDDDQWSDIEESEPENAAVTGCCINKRKTVKSDDEFVFAYMRNRKRPLKLPTSFFAAFTKDPLDALQNFHEVIKDIQNELEQSNFIVRFKEDFHNVLNEWDLSHAITDEDSDSTDLSNYPNGSSLMCEKMQDIDIVCYGLGGFLSCVKARYQLGFLLALKCILKSIHVYIYDPQFSTQEINFLKELKLSVIDINEEAKRTLGRKCVCFMPHCDLPLYNNLLWANWSAKGLSGLVVIGNSFQSYELNDVKGRLKEKTKYVYLANRFVTEIRMSNVFRFSDIFNDLSIHYFKSSSLLLVDSFVWTDLEEPEYTDEDEIIKSV